MSFSINPPNPDEVHPTTFTVTKPIAPNPLDPTSQDPGFTGIRAPGDNGSEHAITSEFIGAQQTITATRPGLKDDHSFDWPQGSPGGKVIPSVIHRGP